MKHYKLLKDLPTFKADDEFELNEKGHLVFVRGTQEVEEGQTLIAYTSYTLEKFPNILKDWFEEMPEQYKRWRAKENRRHYFVDDWGDVDYDYDVGLPSSTFRYNIGNYFKNEEEAEAYKEYLLAKQVLLDDAEGGKWAKNGNNWCAYYDYDFNRWIKHSDYPDNLQIISTIYFQSREGLEQSLKEHKDQWEIVRRYEIGE